MNKVSLCSMVVMGALLLGCSKSPGDLNQEQSSLSTMTEAQAKELALQEVGSGSIIDFSYDHDDKLPHYEFKIVNDGVEHEVEISAIDGSVLKHKTKNHSEAPLLEEPRVREIVETLGNGTIVRVQLDKEDHHASYEVTVVDETYTYEYEIDARDGHVIHQEKELINQVIAPNQQALTIDVEQAKSMASAQVQGGVVTEISLDTDDGTPIYEVNVIANGIEYEYEISAVDGQVLRASTK